MLYVADKTVNELKDKLSKDQFDKIDTAKKGLQDAITSKNIPEIKSKTDELKKILSEIGGSFYSQQGQQTGPTGGGKPGDDGNNTNNQSEKGYEHIKKDGDNVVEGSYEKKE